MAQLDTAKFATASNDGLWSILKTDRGLAIVEYMMAQLDTAKFATASNGGMWSILKTDRGRSHVALRKQCG